LSACPACGATATPEANFCDTCGRPLSPQAWTAIVRSEALQRVVPGEERAKALDYELEAVRSDALQRFVPPGEERAKALDYELEAVRSDALQRVVPPGEERAKALDTEREADTLQQFIPRELQDKLRAARRAGTMAGERRVVTMLFCDIKGSTALAEQLDPEEWSDIVNGAFERMVRPVYRYEGTVARLMGDGLLAFFGAPIAHEDDPRRAVLAGLEIVAGMAEFRTHLPQRARELDVRVGINTGLVVVGAVGSDLRLEYSALGDAINVAARMEQTAVPGTVQITGDTLRTITGQFAVEPLGGIEVKGKAAPVPAYRVLRRRTGVEARRHQVSFRAPLVDRLREWELLRGAFDGLAGGRGGIIFLSGDAGLGKTRLIDEALERLAPPVGAQIAIASAYAYETAQPYGLSTRLLRGVLGLAASDAPETIRARLDDALVGAAAEHRRVLETLFGVSPDLPGHELTGEAFATQLVACVDEFWRGRAAAGPVVLVLDDLQWADASSTALFSHLFGLSESASVLFICAMRRDRHSHGWRLRDAAQRDYPHRFDEAALYPLTDGESLLLLDGLLDGAALPETTRQTILAKAEGNPLFVEEVVHNLIERGHLVRADEGGPWTAGALPAGIELPDSLQALLTARVDRLDEETRRTLQVASVIGRAFSRSALAALVEQPDRLDRHLLELQRMELVREVGRVPEPEYVFHHTLTHEATYNTILVKERRALHRRMAEVLEQSTGGGAAALAHHLLEGNAPERALPYLITAADTALRLNATAEAIAHYQRALPIALAGDDADCLIHLYSARGRALELESRFAEADAVFGELERLGQARSHQAMELAAVIAQGRLRANVTPLYNPVAGRALMQRALVLAEALDDRPAEVRILWNMLNIDRFDVFNLEHATIHGERALALARELGLAEETAYLLNDLGEALGSLGHMDEARAMMGEAVAHWRQLGNEPMLADGLTGYANWTAFGGDLTGARALAEEAYAVNTRIGNPWGQAYSGAVRSLIRSLQGEIGAGVEGLRTAIEKAQEAGFVGGQVLARSFLSQILLDIGAAGEAAAAAEEGLAVGRAQLPQFAGMCLARLALAHIAQGDTVAAAALLDDRLLEGTRQQAFVEIDVTLARIALALAQGDAAGGLARAEAAVARLEETNGVIWLSEVLDARAAALLALGRPAEARDALASAVAVARAAGARGALWNHLARLAAVQAQLGDSAAADTRHEAEAELRFVLENTWPDDLRRALLRAANQQN
jgi:class 3 adenylate cyclase/tetratricopeptide (TPR) repeat protein